MAITQPASARAILRDKAIAGAKRKQSDEIIFETFPANLRDGWGLPGHFTFLNCIGVKQGKVYGVYWKANGSESNLLFQLEEK